MDFLPIFIDIENRNCLLVGGWGVAARKIALLLRAGAHVTVIAPELCSELRDQLSVQLHAQLSRGRITHRAEAFHPDHLRDAVLVVAATDDPVALFLHHAFHCRSLTHRGRNFERGCLASVGKTAASASGNNDTHSIWAAGGLRRRVS